MKNIKKVKIALIAALAATAIGTGAFAVSGIGSRSPLYLAEANTQETEIISANKNLNATATAATVAETPAQTITASTLAQITSAISTSVSSGKLIEIKLTAAISLENTSITFNAGANVRLDLNGNTITSTGASALKIKKDAKVEVCDNSSAQNGCITGGTTAVDNGGGAYVDGGNLTLTSGKFYDCFSSKGGGGVYVANYGTFTMNGGEIRLCDTNGEGGGVFVKNYSTFTMNGGTIDDCSAKTHGGAVSLNYGTFNMYGGTVTRSYANDDGTEVYGGIADIHMYGGEIMKGAGGLARIGVYIGAGVFYMYDGTISGYKFDSGTYMFAGIGVKIDSARFNMYGGTITGNNKGVVCNDYGEFTMYGGTITKGSAIDGSAVYMTANQSNANVSFTMNGGTITGNSNNGIGAGVRISASGGKALFTMNGGTISQNTGGQGGGTGVTIEDSAQFVMNDGVITGNSAYNVGAIWLYGSSQYPVSATINGGVISGNSTGRNGGGIYLVNGTLTVKGGTIVNNEAALETSGYEDFGGGGICVGDGGTLNLEGGLITGNSVYSPSTIQKEVFGGGILLKGTGVMNVSGGTVARNYRSDEDDTVRAYSDVDMLHNKFINVTGKLNNAYIGIGSTFDGQRITSGYGSAGNKYDSRDKYFFSNSGNIISAINKEVACTTTPDPTTRTALTWSYSTAGVSTSVSDPFTPTEVTYSGRNYSVSAGGAAFTIYNASGKIVKSIADAGVYTVFANDAQLYNNPVFTLKVNPADLSGATVTSTNATYTGSAITPTVKVVLGGKTLKKDTDFTVAAKNNINAGNGLVTITGTGNYYGSVQQSFTINQAVIGLRWGNTEVEYNGKEQKPVVLVEGLAESDNVTVNVAYYKDGSVATPINAGTYSAVATVSGNDNYVVRESSAEKDFTISTKKVNAIWGKTNFAFGEAVNLTAYTYDGRGRRVNLEVTVDGETHTATAAFAENYADKANYELLNTSTSYTVGKAEATLEWTDVPDKDLFYDGTAKKPTATMKDSIGNIISEGLSIKYYSDGVEVEEPTAAGTYTARITFEHENYSYSGATDRIFTIKKAEIAVQLDANFNGVYSGEGKTPVTDVNVPEGGTYTVLYAPVDNNGNVLGEYTRLLPVDAGRYAYYVDINDELKHNYAVKTNGNEYFEITAKRVTASWSVNEGCHWTGGKYTWLYDGRVHAPSVKFLDSDGNEIEIGGDNKVKISGASSLLGDYTVRVALESKNYVLSGATTADCNIIKSRVTSVIWYGYGQEEALTFGEVPSFVNLSVYGANGPKLTAYGLLDAADGNWNNSDGVMIQLKVSYDVSYSGYWPTKDNYVARANLNDSDQISGRCTLAGVDQSTLIQRFKVITLADETRAVEVQWVVISDGKHIPASGYNFIYNGGQQCPVPIVILSGDYDAANPAEGTYEVLNVHGGATDAGTHYAYIVLDGTYSIAAEDAGVQFTISPMEIEVAWTVADEYVYNGDPHAPEAEAVDTNYLPCEVTVEGYVNAGEWVAVADAGKNFTITNPEQPFTIGKATVDVEWDVGENGTWNDDNTAVIFEYDGETAFAPTATAVFGETEIALKVTGASHKTGTYYAYATLDGSDYANLNFRLSENTVRVKFIVIRESVNIVWGIADENGEIIETFEDGEDIVFTYDGTPKAIAAYYEIDGVTHVLEVEGEGTAAGTYVAYVAESVDAQNDKTRTFTIAPRALTVSWDELAKEYTGEALFPTVTFSYLDGEETVNVSLIKDVDYSVKGFTEAGTHSSEITFINGNYVVEDGTASGEFTIAKKDLTLTWRGNVNGKFEWTYDGDGHAPTVSPVNGVDITVIGGAVNKGTYTAYAYTDNPNYNLTNPEREFTVKAFEITVTWYGADGVAGEGFAREYDGVHYFAPTATYVDHNGETKPIDVLGAKLYAGEYEATVVLPENCALKNAANGKQKFEITKKVVTSIKWLNEDGEVGDLVWEYDGKLHAPKAVIDDESQEPLIVTGGAINKGTYTAKAELANSENYELKVENATVEFTISPKVNVQITWYGKDDVANDDFVWDYDGEAHAPRATFIDVNGEEVEIPVSGWATDAGAHRADIVDVFDNYEFAPLQTWQNFTVKHIDLTLTWAEGYTEDEDGSYSYSFSYNGKAHQPEVTATVPEEVSLTYYVTDENEKDVGVIINVGTYKVTAVALDKNYKIISVSEVTVKITAMKVNVEWENLSLQYNGKEQAPKAWYEDAYGQRVELAVSGAQTEIGSGYSVSADFKTASLNYELDTNKTNVFAITEQVKHTYVWVWNEDGTGEWKDLNSLPEDSEED